MREHRKLSHILQRSHYFISIIVVFLFLCVKFDNPVDPKFKGSFEFDISNLKDKDSVSLSIFQPCTLTVNEQPNQYSYYYFSSAVEKDSVAIVQQPDSNRFVIFFYKPCTTTVYVNGIRPNDSKDEKSFKFKVVNPFKINETDTIAHNDTAQFSILNDSLHRSPFVADIVRWSMGSITGTKSTNEICSLYVDDPSKDSVALRAELLAITPDTTVSFILSKTMMVRGWAPKITNVQIKNYNPQDTSKKVVNQVDSFKVILTVSDPDSSPYTVSIRADSSGNPKDTILSTFKGDCIVTFPPIKNFLTDSLTITIKDNQSYTITKRFGVNILAIPPEVSIKTSMDVANNKKTVFTVDKQVNCALFKWKLSWQQGKDSSSSSTGSWEIGPFPNWIGVCTLTVTPVSGTNKEGAPKSCTINVKEFKYTTEIKEKIRDTLRLKVNRLDTLHAFVLKELVPQTNSSINFQWKYPSSLKPFIINEDSILIVKCADSIAQDELGVKGIVGTDTASSFTVPVVVSWYRPEFRFVENIYNSIPVNNPVKLNYTFKYTDPESSLVSTFLFKKRSEKNTKASTYDPLKGILFDKVGFDTLDMWCIDNDGTSSNIDNAFFTIVADLPYISDVKVNDSLAINKEVKITGIVANPGKAGIPIDSIFWYRNSDSLNITSIKVVNTTTDITINSNGYSQPVIDTITIYCKDDSGAVSVPVKKYIRIFSDIPKIESFARSDSSKIYKGMPVKFNIGITDPDDDSLVLTILGNNLPFKAVKVAKDDTLSLNFKDSGSYVLKMTAKDDSSHISDEFILSSIVKVDPGIPVVNNIKIPNKLVYIKDAVQCTVSAVDYNGKINKYQYYVNDSLYKDTADSVLNFTFADSGMKKISVKVIDNDTLPSEIKSVSFNVKRGQPVVDSFTVDSNSVYVNGKRTFRILASDSNGIIMRKEIQWNDKIDSIISYNQNASIINESIIDTFEVKDTSLTAVRLRVMDEDSIYSEWKVCSLIVKKGVPKIDSIQIIPAGPIFVRDNITLQVVASDPNDSIKMVDVSWSNNGSFVNMVKTDGKYQVQKFLYKGDSSLNKILIRVTDKSGFPKDSLFSISVLPGYPVISDISPDTVWALRDAAIKVVASDPDSRDYITRRSFDWDTNGIFDITTTSDSITHRWDTLQGNDYLSYFKVMAEDNDTLTSTKLFSVFVKLGRPILSGASFGDSIQWVKGTGIKNDTMFYKWNSGDTYVRINATDPNPNGQIVRYDWNRDDDGTIDYPNDSIKLFKYFEPNTPKLLSVRVRDNDSLWSDKLVFYVFADAAPPAITTTSDAGTGVRIIKWSGKDTKDGNNTLYKIVVKKGTASAADSVTTSDESNPAYIISDFKAGAQYETDNAYDFKFNYPQSVTGIYHYRIIAKDARGSLSKTGGDPQFSF